MKFSTLVMAAVLAGLFAIAGLLWTFDRLAQRRHARDRAHGRERQAERRQRMEESLRRRRAHELRRARWVNRFLWKNRRAKRLTYRPPDADE